MPTEKISDHSGSVSGSNWGPAFLAALAAIKTTGGSILLDVDTEVASQVALSSVSGGWGSYLPLHLVGDGGTQVRFNNSGVTGFYLNENVLSFGAEKINFIGSTDTATNISTAFFCLSLNRATFERCNFAGVQAGSGSIIHIYNNPGVGIIRDCSFNGCGAGGCIVRAEGSELLSLENVTFYDYENFRGQYFNKPAYGPYWIKAEYSGTPDTSHVPTVHLKNVRTDEGSKFAYISGYPRVIVEGGGANSNSVGTEALKLVGVEKATIKDFWVGYTAAGNIPSIRIENCGIVEVDALQVQGGIHAIIVDANSKLVLKNSPGVVVTAAAGAEYEVNGVLYKGGTVQIGG